MATVAADAATPTAQARSATGRRRHPYARFARAVTKLATGRDRAESEEKARARSSADFLKALEFSRLDVTPLEVEMAAYAGFALTFILGGIAGFIVSSYAGLEGLQLSLWSAGPAGAGALGVLLFLANFPEMHASALRARTAGQMPEAISYLALSMQLNPSLTKAVEFAANHTQEPVAGSLRNVLWRVYLREQPRVEDAFVDFAYEWGDWNEDFKKALYTVRAAEMENSAEAREATLDKATTSMYKGARAVIEDFALSLGGPTTVFFAAGIILPMMIGSMLPLLSLGGNSLSPTAVIIMFDVAFPAATFGYSYFILQKRPGTSPLPDIDTSLTPAEKATAAMTAVVLFAASLGVAFLALTTPALGFLGYLPFLWAAGFPIAAYAYITSKRAKKERDRVRKLEQEYPDALYQLGNRMGEGAPVEKALSKTAAMMRGTEVSKLFNLAGYRLQVMKTSLDETLFGPSGVLTQQPSRVVESTMRVVVGATKKEARTAGRTIVSISAYLREMLTVEREIRNRLKDVTDTMLTTGTFFAPIVLGVTVALNLIISNTLGAVDLTNTPGLASFGLGGAGGEEDAPPQLSPQAFGLVVGIYLLFTVIVSTYFVSGIRNGDDRIEWKWMLGNALPGGIIMYTIAVLVVQFTIG